MRWVIWFLFIYALYQAQTMVQDWTEISIGVIVALIAVIIIAVEFRASNLNMQLSWQAARQLLPVPAKMLHDALMVTWRILRGENLEGYFVRVPLKDDPIAIYGISASPNTIVTDVGHDTMLIHKLIATEDE